MRTCEQCGASIPPQQGSARPRKFCVKCRPPRNRPNPRVINLPKPPEPEVPVAPVVSLESTYREQLESAGRLDTPAGALVMHLATLFANGQHTAAGAAALSRELRAAMEVAVRGAGLQGDAVDELLERRRRKATGA